MNLNSQLEIAKNSALECQKRTEEVVNFLRTILNVFSSDAYIQELFATTGFGKEQHARLDALATKLEKIANALDTYVPTTIRTIEYQMALNDSLQGSGNV